jgi:tetratricopeptide (TPR) repeat protein
MIAQELERILSHQGEVGYAGDIPGAPPPPEMSLHDLAVDLIPALRQSQRESPDPIDPDATYFTFQLDRAPSGDPEVISAPKQDLWCLLRSGDIVLVRAGADAHITRIFDVDRQTQTALIADFWPDRFFMVKGTNLFGFSGELVRMEDPFLPAGDDQRILVRVSRDDLARAIVGLITIDTPDLIQGYFSIDPAAETRAEVLLAFGASLLASDKVGMIDKAIVDKGMVQRSISVLERAVELLHAAGETKRETYAVNRLYLAVVVSGYTCVWQKNLSCAKKMQDEIDDLQNRYGGANAILRDNQAVDYVYLGQSAGHANDVVASIGFFTRALQKDPACEEAYYDRGLTWNAIGRKKEAQQDLTAALKLNESKGESIARQMQGRPAWDLYGQAWDNAAEKQRASFEALERQALATLN